jgi:putative heme-binding domain-containing protein
MKSRFRNSLIIAALAATIPTGVVLFAASKNPGKPMDEESILKGIKYPAAFDVTLFAAPPDVMYPTAVAATPAGELYVAIDEDGSLGKEPGKGRIVKCLDTNNDGKADKFITFARMDHPRGLYFDSATDTCYVLHPPFITAFHDDDHDGVSDRSEIIATGIANEAAQKSRGADHTTNGFRLGIDGWMYIAQGDFGSTKAVGKDGTEMIRHGGGVTRIRLDGTGLEMYSTGQRNICDVAVDPLLNVFTRDNTNDGDGWDVRLSYIVPTGYYGYPSKFKHFKDEMIEPLADYGGGSPVGALFLSEPNYPADYGNSLYTVEWGNNAIFRHPLEQTGANFKAGAEQFMKVPRATDMDADALGHLYVSSWVNGGFSYSGPNVGYVLRVTPKDHKPATFPDLKKLPDDQLTALIASPSAVTRQYAQREILTRGAQSSAPFQGALEKLAASKESLPVRVAAMYTLKQLAHEKSNDAIVTLTKNDDLRELALRALADVKNDATVPVGPFVEALTDSNPRVRLMAAYGIGRLGKTEAAPQLLPLTVDADPLVAHVAINAMVALKASAPALKAVDPATPKLVYGALRVLQELHDTQVVEGLAAKLKTAQDASLRTQIYKALCRLNYREADWTGDWWGTRPDTSGPYYKTAEWEGTPKVQATLKEALAKEKPEVIKELVVNLAKNKVDFPELTATLQKLAATDPSFKTVLVDLAADKKDLNDAQIALLQEVGTSAQEPAAVRAKALRVLQKNAGKPAALEAALNAAAAISTEKTDKELTAAFSEFTREAKLSQQIGQLTRISESAPAGAKKDVATLILLNLSNNKLLLRDNRVAALAKTIETQWSNPKRAAEFLGVIGRLHADAFTDRVKTLSTDPNPQIATAAKTAASQLGMSSGKTTIATTATLIEKMKYEDVVAIAIKERGNPILGKELFTKQGCIQCHTVSAEEPPKGPFLGDVAARYGRPELCESILKPSAKIAQGFETQWFKDKDDEDYEGFVTREAGDEIDLRNILGVTVTLKKSDIKERGKRDISVMPEALVAKLTPQDLASILAYLESLKK